MPDQSSSSPQRSPGRLTGALGVGMAVLITIGLTTLLHTRAALTETRLDKNLLTVETVNFQLQDSYRRTVSYLGLVAAGRKADLAFEIPGRIDALPHRQGSPVQAGEVIAQLDDASLLARRDATTADLKRARAELELAGIKAQRQRDLRATGAVSREAFDETRLQAQALEAQVEAVNAQLAAIDIDLRKTRLLAPYDGVIADRYLHEGTVISPGVPVVKLVASASREAHVGVSASRAGELQPGAGYSLTLRDKELQSTLLSVRPDVDPVTRSTTAVFAIPAEFQALDGEPVTLQLAESVPLRGGWLPIAALLEGQRGLWTVLRLERDNGGWRTVRESVEVLDIQADRAYVRGTLGDEAQVVASGTHRITPGTPVLLAGTP